MSHANDKHSTIITSYADIYNSSFELALSTFPFYDELGDILPYYDGTTLYIGIFTVCGINTLHAKFFRGNKNIYLHCMSFIHIDKTQVVDNFPQLSKNTYSI